MQINTAIFIKGSKARALFLMLLIAVASLAPAVSMANVMLHLPYKLPSQEIQSSDAVSQNEKALTGVSEVDSPTVDLPTGNSSIAGESCHEMESHASEDSQDNLFIHAAQSASENCCESSCECSVMGYNSHPALATLNISMELGVKTFYVSFPNHYSSVNLPPQSPPPTR